MPHRPAFVIDRSALLREAAAAGMPTTTNALARVIGCSPSQLSRVLSGRSTPGADLLALLHRAFGPAAYDRIVRIVDGPPPG